MRWKQLLVVALVGCKSGHAPAGPGSGSGSGVAAGSAVAAVAHDAPVPDAASDPRCADACLVLADTALADAPQAFTRACDKPWPYAADDCDDLLLELNCIYAAHGNVFKHQEWKDAFEHKAWYHARADFKDADLGAIGTANVRALKQRHEPCTKAVTPEDRTLATQTFASLVDEDGSDDALRSEFHDYAVFDDTKLSYVPADAGRRAIKIERLYHAVGPGNYEDTPPIVLTFDDKNQLVDVTR